MLAVVILREVTMYPQIIQVNRVVKHSELVLLSSGCKVYNIKPTKNAVKNCP